MIHTTPWAIDEGDSRNDKGIIKDRVSNVDRSLGVYSPREKFSYPGQIFSVIDERVGWGKARSRATSALRARSLARSCPVV